MSDFVDSPMKPIAPVPAGYKGGPGEYNGSDCPPFDEYKRTSSPNSGPEKIIDGSVPKIPVPIPQATPEGLSSKG
jgi:hypothetical protein